MILKLRLIEKIKIYQIKFRLHVKKLLYIWKWQETWDERRNTLQELMPLTSIDGAMLTYKKKRKKIVSKSWPIIIPNNQFQQHCTNAPLMEVSWKGIKKIDISPFVQKNLNKMSLLFTANKLPIAQVILQKSLDLLLPFILVEFGIGVSAHRIIFRPTLVKSCVLCWVCWVRL